MRKLVVVPLLALLLGSVGGCINLGLGSAKTPPALMTLTATQAPADGSNASGKTDSALTVLEPQTDAKLAVLRVPVTVDAARVAYLKQALWVERPARLFQHLLAETLRARGTALVTEGDTMTRGPVLSGRLLDFGYDAQSQAAVVRFDAIRRLPDGTVQTHRFEASVDHVTATAGEVGVALNQAANQVAKAVADWMA